MAFFQKNISNFLDRLTVFCIFSYIRFHRWGRRPLSSKPKSWAQVCSIFLRENGVQDGQNDTTGPSCYWPVVYPEADVGHFECPNQGDQHCILPIHHGFFGADDASLGLTNRGFCPKNADGCDDPEVVHKDGPVDGLPWASTEEKGGVFGILRDQSEDVCGLLLQRRIRKSWYL
jgi:hypothetical protein